MSNAITFTSGNFDVEVVQSPIPVLVDFWAPWCGPCKMLGPIVEELAGEYQGRFKIGKINVDEESDLAAQHDVSSIPTLVIYKGGQLVFTKLGALPKAELDALLAKHL